MDGECRVSEVLGPGLQWSRICSAVLVHTKGWQRSFQPSMKVSIAPLRSCTLVMAPGR
jgi:hypothetical protein